MAIEKEITGTNGQACKYLKIDKIEADYFNMFSKRYYVILKKYTDESYREKEKEIEEKITRYRELLKKESLKPEERKELETFNPRALSEQYYNSDYSLGTEKIEIPEEDLRELVYNHIKTLPQFADAKDILER